MEVPCGTVISHGHLLDRGQVREVFDANCNRDPCGPQREDLFQLRPTSGAIGAGTAGGRRALIEAGVNNMQPRVSVGLLLSQRSPGKPHCVPANQHLFGQPVQAGAPT
jgi:hypothetical protein